MKGFKKALLNLIIMSLLLSDVIFGFNGCGNIFIGINLINVLTCFMVLIVVVTKTEDKSLDELRKPSNKISILWDSIILVVLMYFGWWFNFVVWGLGLILSISIRKFLSEEVTK